MATSRVTEIFINNEWVPIDGISVPFDMGLVQIRTVTIETTDWFLDVRFFAEDEHDAWNVRNAVESVVKEAMYGNKRVRRHVEVSFQQAGMTRRYPA